MMYYLAIQNNYNEVQFSLMSGTTAIISDSLSKLHASKELVAHLNTLLISHNLTLSDLSFIAANCGPGPFTTLRVVITTVNGIAYASKLPLIGINALEAFAHEWNDDSYAITAILFNAFGNDLYALVTKGTEHLLYGVYSIQDLLHELDTLPGTIRFLGNGTDLHAQIIREKMGDKAYIPESNPEYSSLASIARMGLEKWKSEKHGASELMPLYLKQHPAQR